MEESKQVTITLRDYDGTLRQTKAYLQAYGLSEDEVTDMLYLLPYYGGYCDCEVIYS